ncbi:MAG: hypothetical protein LBT00_10225 [Spirochaetaceae bacterium]|jgi:hypothetical protein|nr:hypothetical protein [Spirochaetaceae bacterium]
MRHTYKIGLFLVVLVMGGAAGFSQEGDSVSIPDAIRRPSRTDTPRYPRDVVIGDLGQGDLLQEDMNYASTVLRALLQGREQSPLFSTLNEGVAEDLIGTVQKIRAHKFRIGGGKEIVDGAGSFLFRFIGRDDQIGGAMYFVRGESGYALDDIILEAIPKALLDGERDPMSDTFPYERFY